MIVEFVGLPGSGKSTVAAAVTEGLERHGITTMSTGTLRRPANGDGNARPRPYRLSDLRLSMHAALHVWRSPRPARDRLDAWKWLWVTIGTHRLAGRQPVESVCILEEGLTQRLFLLFVEAEQAVDRAGALRFARRCPPADLSVLLDVPAVTVMDRVAGRDRGLPPRLAGLPDGVLAARLEEGRALLSAALEQVSGAHAGRTVLRMDGTDAVETLTAGIIDQVLAMLQEAVGELGEIRTREG